MTHLIFLPGFYGTRLVRKADGRLVWISARQAVFGSQTAARTGFGVSGAQELVPGTVLDRVPVIPGVYDLDVYRDFLDDLQTRVHLLGYDWREDYFEAVKKLAGLVHDLKAGGASSIILLAHSLGGVVASYYLRYGDQEPEAARETWQGVQSLDAVVMATAPFQGSMTAFRNMKHGAKFGLNTSLISPHAFSTFTTGYTMLPTYRPVLLDHRLRPLPHTFFEPALWQRYAWGLLSTAGTVSADVTEKRKRINRFDAEGRHVSSSKRLAFIGRSLRRGTLLYERLHQPLSRPPEQPVRLLYAFARSHATLSRAVLLERDAHSPARVIFERREFEAHLPGQRYGALCSDGDQTLTTESAQLPPAFKQALRVEEHASQAIHSQIFNDRQIRGKIRAFLRAER